MRALGCHVYGGGFALGMVRGGAEVIHHLEPAAYKGFGVECATVNLGVETTVGEDLWRGHRFRGAIDVVFGNPPCAAYSGASHGMEGKWRDERRSHAFTMLRLLDEVRPAAWVLESVPGIMTKGAGVVAAIESAALEAGYSMTYWKHDHKFLGLPQRRARVYLIAHRVDLRFPDLGRTLFTPDFDGLLTVEDAIADLEDPGPYVEWKDQYRPVYEMTPPGGKPRQVYLEHFEDDPDVSPPGFIVMRLRMDAPSVTLLGDPGKYLHPVEERMIGLDEATRLCGYPDDWIHVGRTLGERWQHLCKASLPTGGAALGPILRDGIDRGEPPSYRAAVVDQHQQGVGLTEDRCRNRKEVLIR